MSSNPVTIDAKLAKSLVPRREPGAHKWNVGGVLVIAGSPLYPGAAWLASRAAGRAGAGIVLLASGRTVVNTIASSLPEVAHVILPESDTQSGAKRTLELIGEKLDRVKSVVVGPGLGDDDSTAALLGTLFGIGRGPLVTRDNIGFGQRAQPLASSFGSSKKTEETVQHGAIFGDGSIPVVIDADGLNWLAKQSEWWTKLPPGLAVLTPHVGELSRLLDIEPDDVLKNPQKHAEQAASKWSQIVVLKAGQTIATNGKRSVIAERDTPALATAGSGDVFAGTIGALLAQGLTPLDAATLAIYLGSAAASELATDFGDLGVISTDLPDAIARATRTLIS